MERMENRLNSILNWIKWGVGLIVTVMLGTGYFVVDTHNKAVKNELDLRALEGRVTTLEIDPINTIKFEIILTKLDLVEAIREDNHQLIYEYNQKIKELTNKLMLASKDSEHTYRGK